MNIKVYLIDSLFYYAYPNSSQNSTQVNSSYLKIENVNKSS